MYYTEYPSPVGTLLLTTDGESLTGLWMDIAPPAMAEENGSHPVLQKACQWLDHYFRGEEQKPDFPLNPPGSPFRKQVWQILLTIPRGKVRTYGDIAREMAEIMGKEKMSAQAVGSAVGSNPISILIPCHRCIGAKGKLVGYEWGLDRKQWLLEHEGLFLRQKTVK